ncbi:hypothetical protein BSKO_08956 [Bryopsis sp. KO-2023]|nr:hypothetical protein BSKO_08956 [Bryopsis sp. KO-2023]
MAPRRTNAGHTAERLRLALISRLDPEEHRAQYNQTLIRAIGSCDKFLHSGKGSENHLTALKQKVYHIVNEGLNERKRLTRGSARQPRSASHEEQNRSVVATNTPRSAGTSTECDWTMPPLILQRKAHVKSSEFGKMIQLQDQWAKNDDSLRWSNRRDKMKMQRRVLDQQMNRIASCKEQARLEKERESQEISAGIREYENEELREFTRKKDAQTAAMKMFAEQVCTMFSRDSELYSKMLEERELRRLRELDAVKEKQRLMMERGGGPALQKSLEEQTLADQLRMERAQKEYERKQAELDDRRAREKKQRQVEMMEKLGEQVSAKKQMMAADLAEEQRLAREFQLCRQQEIEAEKREQASHKEKMRLRAQQQKLAIKEEAKKRYTQWREPMDSQECKIHHNVMNGKQRGFITLPATQGY